MLREVEIGQFPSSKQASSLTNSEVYLFPLPVVLRSDFPVGRRFTQFVEQRQELTVMDLLYLSKRVQDPIQVTSSHIGCSDKSDSNTPLIARRDRKT